MQHVWPTPQQQSAPSACATSVAACCCDTAALQQHGPARQAPHAPLLRPQHAHYSRIRQSTRHHPLPPPPNPHSTPPHPTHPCAQPSSAHTLCLTRHRHCTAADTDPALPLPLPPRLVEEADYAAAKELFGGGGSSSNPLDSMLPKSSKDMEEYATLLANRWAGGLVLVVLGAFCWVLGAGATGDAGLVPGRSCCCYRMLLAEGMCSAAAQHMVVPRDGC